MTNDVIIEVKALRKSFGDHVAVRDLDLSDRDDGDPPAHSIGDSF